MKTLNALTVRKKFGSILDEVARTGEPVTITRANRPLVILVPVDHLAARGTGSDRTGQLRLAADRLAEWRRQHAHRLRDLDPVALVRRDRER